MIPGRKSLPELPRFTPITKGLTDPVDHLTEGNNAWNWITTGAKDTLTISSSVPRRPSEEVHVPAPTTVIQRQKGNECCVLYIV
jgi:hypothetical protein